MHLTDIQHFRLDCENEKNKPVRVSAGIKVNYTELSSIPDMHLKFIVGGGVVVGPYDYEIVGGPDNGKRITLIPWRSKWALGGAEAESAYGYTSRPALQYHGTLHISTIMFLRGMLIEAREHLMGSELKRMYEKLYEEREKAAG